MEDPAAPDSSGGLTAGSELMRDCGSNRGLPAPAKLYPQPPPPSSSSARRSTGPSRKPRRQPDAAAIPPQSPMPARKACIPRALLRQRVVGGVKENDGGLFLDG